MTTIPNEKYNCPHCGTPIYANAVGQVRRQDTGSHHTPGGPDCVQVLKKQRDEARAAARRS